METSDPAGDGSRIVEAELEALEAARWTLRIPRVGEGGGLSISIAYRQPLTPLECAAYLVNA